MSQPAEQIERLLYTDLSSVSERLIREVVEKQINEKSSS